MSIPNLDPDTLRNFQQPQVAPVAPQPTQVAPGPAQEAQIFTQIQQRQQQRSQDVGIQNAQLDEADKFEQNAALVEDEAQASRQAAEEIRADVGALEDQNQAEEAEEAQVIDQVENQQIVEVFETNKEELRKGIAESLGLKDTAIDDDVESKFKDLEAILTGRLDENNAAQVALKEKLDTGAELDTKEKIAVGMTAILPLIIGFIKKKPLQGVIAASQAIGRFQQQRSAAEKTDQAEITKLGDEQLKLIDLSSKILSRGVSAVGSSDQNKIDRALGIESVINERIKQKGLTIKNIITEEAAKQGILKTEDLLRKAEKELLKGADGDIGKVSRDQSLAARFAIQASQAEEFFGTGFIPKPGQMALPNVAQSSETQQFSQAALQFVNSTLRPESGAAISLDELTKGERQYIPKFGDSKEALERKRQARIAVAAGNHVTASTKVVEATIRQMERLQGSPSGASGDVAPTGLTPEEKSELEALEKEGF